MALIDRPDSPSAALRLQPPRRFVNLKRIESHPVLLCGRGWGIRDFCGCPPPERHPHCVRSLLWQQETVFFSPLNPSPKVTPTKLPTRSLTPSWTPASPKTNAVASPVRPC